LPVARSTEIIAYLSEACHKSVQWQARRPYSVKVEENSMAARKSGHSVGSRVSQVLKELADTIGKAMGRSAELSNAVPGLALYQNTTPTAPNPCSYEPSLLIVPQGKKHVDLGKQSYVFGESTFLLTSIELPIVSRVCVASVEKPDSDYSIWQAFHNEAWPAQYIVDGKGQIRYRHYGEGEYVEMERVIQKLLKENGADGLDESTVTGSGTGIEAAPSSDEQSPETYVGYRQAEHFASPERVARDSQRIYSAPASPSLNQWGLGGSWNVGPEAAVLQVAPGKLVFRFHSRDLNLILAPMKDGKPVRFKVTLDGAAPGENNGVDSAADGGGEIREPRMYQLIRQKGPIVDRTFEIEFLDHGVQALDFTFG
jgi:Thioredoxin like C-terminal domain/AraC-type transcriptional regulator N-terminus